MNVSNESLSGCENFTNMVGKMLRFVLGLFAKLMGFFSIEVVIKMIVPHIGFLMNAKGGP